MPEIEPLSREQLPEFEPMFQMLEKSMGFIPNSLLTMARRPAVLRGFLQLAVGVYGMPGEEMPVEPELMRFIAHIASKASGCRYCQAHTANEASRLGVSAARLEAVWEFESSPLFTAAERAALRFAVAASVVPNATNEQSFADLRQHFSDEQIVHIMSVISLFGFLNRWNDSLATTLEREPRSFAQKRLAASGWEIGKH